MDWWAYLAGLLTLPTLLVVACLVDSITATPRSTP